MKISARLLVILVWAGFAWMTVPASADTLQMKDGRVIQGRFFGGTQASVQFETNGKIELYGVDDIISVTFTSASTGFDTSSCCSRRPAFGPSCSRYTSRCADCASGCPANRCGKDEEYYCARWDGSAGSYDRQRRFGQESHRRPISSELGTGLCCRRDCDRSKRD